MDLSLLDDDFFTEQSMKMTSLLLEQKLDIDTIALCVKDYTKKYLHIKKSVPSMANEFTCIMWWKTQSWYKESERVGSKCGECGISTQGRKIRSLWNNTLCEECGEESEEDD